MRAGDGDVWAVIVSTSQSWHNYRHTANALSMYHAVRKLGVPDRRIVLMLAGDVPCNPRNPLPAQMCNSAGREDTTPDLYTDDVQVDYRDAEVSVSTLLQVLTDRVPSGTPESRRLHR